MYKQKKSPTSFNVGREIEQGKLLTRPIAIQRHSDKSECKGIQTLFDLPRCRMIMAKVLFSVLGVLQPISLLKDVVHLSYDSCASDLNHQALTTLVFATVRATVYKVK